MGLHIRLASIEEAPVVCDVMVQAFEEYRGKLNPPSGALSESIAIVEKAMRMGEGAVIAWDGHRPVGSARYAVGDDFTYISRVSVVPSERGRGVGKAMIHFIENLSRERGVMETQVEVRLSIPTNVDLYKKWGYAVVAMHEYPENTDQWYTMNKSLA